MMRSKMLISPAWTPVGLLMSFSSIALLVEDWRYAVLSSSWEAFYNWRQPSPSANIRPWLLISVLFSLLVYVAEIIKTASEYAASLTKPISNPSFTNALGKQTVQTDIDIPNVLCIDVLQTLNSPIFAPICQLTWLQLVLSWLHMLCIAWEHWECPTPACGIDKDLVSKRIRYRACVQGFITEHVAIEISMGENLHIHLSREQYCPNDAFLKDFVDHIAHVH